MKFTLRAVADRFLPDWTTRWRTRRWLTREAQRLRRLRDTDPPLEKMLGEVMASAAFRPQQRPPEILSLLRLVEHEPPGRVLEIGGRRGGTLFLFSLVSDPRARLLSIDLGYTPIQLRTAACLAGSEQEAICMRADSHALETLSLVRRWLRADLIDFLFIDGDHSYDGVARDLELFGPLVREGGTIAFHDIVPDSMMRSGAPSASYAGEVPRFWQDLKSRGLAVTEFVEDPEQDGMGIGVIRLTPEWIREIRANAGRAR